MTGKPLIESDRVEGTTVYGPSGNNIGSIKRLMIEKISGRVAYAVMSFGGFLGMGTEEHAVPWNKLTYDTNLGGYRTDITEQQLGGAPAFSRDRTYDWNDRNRERELHDYYGAPYYPRSVEAGPECKGEADGPRSHRPPLAGPQEQGDALQPNCKIRGGET
jgi:PRC-barrel domain